MRLTNTQNKKHQRRRRRLMEVKRSEPHPFIVKKTLCKRCSLCGQFGHNRLGCSHNPERNAARKQAIGQQPQQQPQQQLLPVPQPLQTQTQPIFLVNEQWLEQILFSSQNAAVQWHELGVRLEDREDTLLTLAHLCTFFSSRRLIVKDKMLDMDHICGYELVVSNLIWTIAAHFRHICFWIGPGEFLTAPSFVTLDQLIIDKLCLAPMTSRVFVILELVAHNSPRPKYILNVSYDTASFQ